MQRMKPKTQFSMIGSILLAFSIAHFTALGQGAAPGPEHEALKKLEGTWNAKVKMGDDESAATRSEERRVGKECRSRWTPGHTEEKGGALGGSRALTSA